MNTLRRYGSFAKSKPLQCYILPLSYPFEFYVCASNSLYNVMSLFSEVNIRVVVTLNRSAKNANRITHAMPSPRYEKSFERILKNKRHLVVNIDLISLQSVHRLLRSNFFIQPWTVFFNVSCNCFSEIVCRFLP